jgi:uncharacterized protein
MEMTMSILRKISSWLTTDPRESSAKDQELSQLENALLAAAELGSVEEVKKLLAKGVDVNEKDIKGRTALMWAAFKGHADVVKELLASGADLNAKDNYDYTALKFVDLYRHNEIAEILKESGAIE